MSRKIQWAAGVADGAVMKQEHDCELLQAAQAVHAANYSYYTWERDPGACAWTKSSRCLVADA